MTLRILFFEAATAIWLFAAAVTVYCLARQKFLAQLGASDWRFVDAPLVSVLVPARNEGGRVLADCIRSILAQDYGHFEVIAIDDRSTDSTASVLRDLAAGDGRLRLITGTEPGAGWLGKPWALQQAIESSQGEWLLATDADMIFESTALRTSMSLALESGLDALTLIPRFDAHSFWERIFIPTWLWRLLVVFVLGGLNNPDSPRAKGMGGFFLIRRGGLEKCGGFSAVKAELVEDVQLAHLLKRRGLRLGVEYAPGLVRTRMYSSFKELWESCSRNWYALLNYSLSSTISLAAVTLAIAVAPPLLAVMFGLMTLFGRGANAGEQFIFAASVWVIQVILLALIGWRHGIPPAYAFTTPLGFALQCAILLNSTFRVRSNKGVTWKGRRIHKRPDGSVLMR